MNILLIRHAQSQFNAKETHIIDSDLTKLGRKQAIEVATFLKRKFDDINGWTGYVSPFLRTLQTAKTIHEYTDVKFQVDVRIAEFYSAISGYRSASSGAWPAISVPMRKDKFPDFFNGIQDDVWKQKLEFENNLLKRLVDFIKFLQRKDGQYIIVSHAMPIYSMIYILLGTPTVPKWDKKILNTSVTWFDNGKLRQFAKHVNSDRDPRPDTMHPIMFI